MTAYLDKAVGCCEFLIEFTEQVEDVEVERCFNAHGAKGVNVMTFGNDKGRGAAIALTRITDLQAKEGFKLVRGEISDSLNGSLASLKKAQKEEVTQQEFNEKLQAAEKISFNEFKSKIEEVHDEVQVLGQFQKDIKDDVQSIGNDMHSHAVKLESIEGGVQSQAVKLDGIEQGVLNVIQDYQNEIKSLKEALSKANAARDTTEGKLGHKTRIVNQQDAYIVKLEEEQALLVKEKQAWIYEKNKLLNQNMVLQAELDQIRDLRQILDKADHLAGILSSTLAEERAAKRPRV